MIKRSRKDIAKPAALDVKSEKAVNEKAKVEKHYTGVPAANKTYKFTLYKDKEIKTALGKLFKNKCAYCESHYPATHPVDVEHFRPKGEIEKEDGTTLFPGYWWLGASWENLLPSCIHCNRSSKHLLPNGEERLLGKGNRFPLAPGHTHARIPGHEIGEMPLLIDPTRVDPSIHLEFIADLNSNPFSSVVRAKIVDGAVSEAGSKSIDIYGLNRIDLVNARVQTLKMLSSNLKKIERNLKKLENSPSDGGREEIIKEVIEDIAEVKEVFLDDSTAYSAALRAFFNQWLEKFRGWLTADGQMKAEKA